VVEQQVMIHHVDCPTPSHFYMRQKYMLQQAFELYKAKVSLVAQAVIVVVVVYIVVVVVSA
jgi:hypothetical protein